MKNLEAALVFDSIHRILSELVDGPALDQGTWVLDPDPSVGLLATLGSLSGVQASARPIPGESSIAGHANHLHFSLGLLNRWASGENPFEGADWKGSWKTQEVTEVEWKSLIDGLGQQAHAWIKAMDPEKDWDAISLTGAVGNVAHLAYHLGAIRNMLEMAKREAVRE